jgi:TolB-like protein/Flp pilus assembly protein TadD/tRNA A-37 threonylcarbamoyl transferase component Bud32
VDLKPDQHISHYRLIEQIGAGGMGIVWSAQDTRLKRRVAIKILPAELTADPERRLRFQREAETAASLSHPNIAVIYEVGEHEGAPFLAMELLAGRTLREVVGNRALTPREWLKYALPIASALAHAHKCGIVHRDLKSANVMVTDDGHVKLLDFGLAKLLEPESTTDSDVHTQMETISAELTHAGRVLGTVAYMSPEQARGASVDRRSDIFSFGVLLYELITGRLPFTGNTDIESLNATLTLDPSPVSELNADATGEAGRIVAKALEKEPERRYQTADDMVSDFRNFKRDIDTGRTAIPGTGTGPIAAATGGTATAGAARRIPPLVIGAVAAIVLIVVIAVVALQLRSGDESEITETPRHAGGTAGAGSNTPGAIQPANAVTRVVVLPFENLGDAGDAYFAAGVTEEIIGRLSSVRDLAVISRSSAFQYEKSGRTMQQIGADFGVDYILDGTVRWARSGEQSRVRISPQLVRVADDTGVWSETYDSSMDDIFQVQSDIAGKVIDALGVVLGAGDRASLAAKPTDSQDAYQAYLRGIEALTETPTRELAQRMFERAVELDPGFYQAWAGLSRAHSWRFHGGDRKSGRCDAAKEAADEAMRLAPQAPEARMALGLYYYRCFRDYDRALAEIEIAGRDRPNDVDVISWKATLNKRQGNLEEAIRLNSLALELDPMDYTSASELGVCYNHNRQYAEAEDAFNLAISIGPDVPNPYMQQARVYYRWKGTTDESRAMLEAMPRTDLMWVNLAQYELEFFDGQYEKAIATLGAFPEITEDQTTLNVRSALEAHCYDAMGNSERARELREGAVKLLQEKARENPEDFRVYSDLGPELAALGRRQEALAAARKAVELMPRTKDAEAADMPEQNFVLTHVLLGDLDTALELAADLLAATPGEMTVAYMRLDPRWKPLVDYPRFADLER